MSVIAQQPILSTVIEFPHYHGYISVSPNGRYFQDEVGQSFLVIGQNDAVCWPGLVELFRGESPAATEQYIMDLRAHGVTVSRVMIEYAENPFTYFETTPGIFSQVAVHFWDEFIQLAEKHGLYLLLTPYDTFWQAKKWDTYPYSAAAGGPCQQHHDWITLRESIEAQKARWEFIIRRWGGSPSIFAWDIMNEIDLWFDSTPEEISAYISEMVPYIRQLEQSIWGRNHLIGVSSSAAIPDGALGEAIYNHPLIDFANTHLYVNSGVCKPTEAVTAAVEIIQGVEQSLQMLDTPRPYFDSETGPVYGWIKDEALDQVYHHNISWAHLASGAAGSGMRWPYTTPHCILPCMRDNLQALARFAAAVDWTHFNSTYVGDRLSTDRAGIIMTGCADSKTAVLWLLKDSREGCIITLSQMFLTLRDTLVDGTYVVEFIDTTTGCPMAAVPAVTRGGQICFKLPDLAPDIQDIAILIHRVR